MKMAKVLILTVLFVISIGFVLAQNATVNFKDAVTSGTTQTYQRLCAEYPGGVYPTGTAAGRYIVQFYKTGADGVINPLNSVTHQPTGTNVALTNTNNNQLLTILSTTLRPWNATGIIFPPSGTAENGHQGDKIFAVAFNSNASIAAATKYMVWNGVYTVGTATTQNVYVNTFNTNTTISPTGWSSWTPFAPPNPILSGSITSNYSVTGVTLTCSGTYSETQVTTASGTFAFSMPTASNVTITPSKTGYVFNPASYTNSNVTGDVSGITFNMIAKSPNLAVNPIPAISATNVSVLLGTLEWDFTVASGYSAPTGFKVYFPYDTPTPEIVPYVEGITHYTYAVPQLAYNQMYSWKVVPTNALKSNIPDVTNRSANPRDNGSKSDANGAIVWSFTTKAATIIYPGINAGVDFDGGGSLGTFIFSTPSTAVEPGTPQIVYLVIPLDDVPELPATQWITSGYAMNMTAPTTTTLTVTVPAGTWYVSAYYNGRWNHGTPANPVIGPSQVVFEGLPFGGKGDIPIIFTEGPGDPTLPVTLSSFTAIYSVGFFVQLTWVVQSETNHLGYNILRSDDAVLANAVKINPSFVSSGSASGTQITYNYRDEEIIDNSTYNYWLESVDLDGTTHFFGPVNVIVNNDTPDIPPVIPTVTELLNAYPNPFNPMTLIPYTLKSKGEVKIDIYNVKGELVRNLVNESKNAGTYQIPWNGKDGEGKSVSSGIYYYRMSSGKYTASKKIILVK